MNKNLIQSQREGGISYPPNPITHIESLGLPAECVPDDYSHDRIMNLTTVQAQGLAMQQMSKDGDFDLLVPLIEQCLHTASAPASEFERLADFQKRAKPDSPASRLSASNIAFDAYELRRKTIEETKTSGHLDYSEVKKGINLQPDTPPLVPLNNPPAEIPAVSNTEPGMLAY